jgi:DNA-binding protein HU-beta
MAIKGHRPMYRRVFVNKAELIDALAARLGEKKTASAALDAVLAEIQAVVTKGDKVSITGFGVFEKRVRAARMARNPRTGEAVKVKKTAIPAFRAGASFKEMVASGKAPAPAKKAAAKTTAKAAPAKKAAAKTTAAKKTAPAKKAPAKKAPAKTVAARKTVATKTTAKKAPAKAPAKKATKSR